MDRQDQGSMLIEILVSLIILGIVGVAMINAMTSSNLAARKVQAKSASFYQLTSAAEAYSATPFVDCSPTQKNPYSLPSGAVPAKLQVAIETLTKSGTTWNWRQCGSGTWSDEVSAKVQRFTLKLPSRTSTCTTSQSQSGGCFVRSFLKSDTNATSQYSLIGGFRIWPVSPVNLVWNESRPLALKVAGLPAPNDKVVFTVVGTSPIASVLPDSGGVTIVAGNVSGQYTFTLQAYDMDAKVAATTTTLTVNVVEPLTVTSTTSLSGNAGFPPATPFQITYRGGNAGPATFSLVNDSSLFTLTSDGKFNWTANTPGSTISGSYSTLNPYLVPIRISQAGLTSSTFNMAVTLFSAPRLIRPTPPPLTPEIPAFDVGVASSYQVQAVGGNPAAALGMTTSATKFTLSTVSASSGVSSASLTMNTRSMPTIDQYVIPLTLSGAGWPSSVSTSFTVVVRPIVNDPGPIDAPVGQTTNQTLTCTCTGATNPTFRIDSSWPGSGFSLSSSGALTVASNTPSGWYFLPVTVTARAASGTLITSGIRNLAVNVYGELRIVRPTTDETLGFNYGSTSSEAIQATGGKAMAITMTTSASQFVLGTASFSNGVTTAQLTQRSSSLPSIGEYSVPITLSGAGTSTSVTSNISVRVRPVLATATLTGMNGFASSSSLTGLCTCTGAASTRYRIGSTFSNSRISLSSAGLLSWEANTPAATYTIPVIVSAANSSGVFIDSLETNITLRIAPSLTLTAPTSALVGGFGSAPSGGFTMTATGGNGSSASFKISSGYANASLFTVTTLTASYNASSLTSVGTITYSATAPVGTYQVPIALFGAGAPSDVAAGTVTVIIQPTLAVTSTASANCQSFNSTAWSSNLCSVTINYTSGTGSGLGIRLSQTPIGTYGFSWSTSNSSQDISTPLPALGGANSITLYFWKSSTGFCQITRGSITNTSGTITITLQDPGSSRTVTSVVNIKC